MFRYTFTGKAYETQEFCPFSLGPITECPISINFKSNSSPSAGMESLTGSDVGYESPPNSPRLLIKDITVPDTSELLQTFPTYFEKNDRSESRVTNFFDYIFGFAAINGIQKKEKLLPVNEVITALGRITKTGNGLYALTAPSVPNSVYMLTVKPIEGELKLYYYR